MRDIPEAYCSICSLQGPFHPFFDGASLRESRCPGCGSSRRNRDLARVLLDECGPHDGKHAFLATSREAFSSLRIYELQSKGALHDALRGLPGYISSEYFRDVPPGKYSPAHVLCQDATRLTFDDASFDVVISQDIMEHIEEPWRAFDEIARVLRPGGIHLFTIPLHEGVTTRQRARTGKDGKLEYLLPPVRHKDPLDPAGALVFWDYGDDLPVLLAERGISVRKASHTQFYERNELCFIDSEDSWKRCLEACEQGRHVSFFLYNSAVFIAEGKGRAGKHR